VAIVCYFIGRGHSAEYYGGEILWRDIELRRKTRKIKELRQILQEADDDDDDDNGDWWKTGGCPY
jgi:hypothetical protein